MGRKGKLLVISGPSGVGKGTIISQILQDEEGIWKSVSATTRKPRKGEVDGIDYFFLDEQEFQKLVSDDGLLEWAEYAGNCYGTPKLSVQEHLDSGEDVILEIDVQGAFQIKDAFPDAVLVFIEPPSEEELLARLKGRDSEDDNAVAARMKAAKMEMSRKMEYDVRFVNDDLADTVKQIEEFIEESR